MRAIAVMRERYGFTATESLEMPYQDFDRWLSALADDQSPDDMREESDTWQAVTDRSV